MTTNDTMHVVARQPRASHFPSLTIADATTFATAVAKADGMIPRAYLNNPGKILACVLAGQELGVGPMASLRAFHIVEGKPVASYDFWIARLRAAGYRVEWPQLTSEAVTLRLTSPNGETHTETWDKARAQSAGLWGGKDPWKKYPQTMLQARCVATAGRAFAGEVMFGCYEADEADALRGDPAPVASTPPAEARVAAVLAAPAVDPDSVPARARAIADRCKAAGLTRDDLFAVMRENDIDAQRLTECTVEQLVIIGKAIEAHLKFTTPPETPATTPPSSVYPTDDQGRSRYAGD
jgi:hypothetical protein